MPEALDQTSLTTSVPTRGEADLPAFGKTPFTEGTPPGEFAPNESGGVVALAEAARELRSAVTDHGGQALTRFHERLLAEELTAKSGDSTRRLANALSEARVDLNPHQVEAAAFALEAMNRGGCMLADEVGLGKTIEAGIVNGQLVAEGKSRILILAPATLRAQWQTELLEKFDLDTTLVDGRSVRATGNVFDQPVPVICSHPFAAN